MAEYKYQDKLLVRETFNNGLRFYFEYMGSGPEARCTRTWSDEGIYDHQLVYDVDAKRTVVTNSLGHATTYQGNKNGLVVEMWDARCGVSRTEYNKFNDILGQPDALGHLTTYTYDECSNCTLMQLPDGNEQQWVYDALGQLTKTASGLGEQWQWTYDEASNVSTYIDPASGVLTYTHVQGRLVALTDEGTHQATRLAYDMQGNLVELHTPDGQTSRFLCDDWGRHVKHTDARGNVQ